MWNVHKEWNTRKGGRVASIPLAEYNGRTLVTLPFDILQFHRSFLEKKDVAMQQVGWRSSIFLVLLVCLAAVGCSSSGRPPHSLVKPTGSTAQAISTATPSPTVDMPTATATSATTATAAQSCPIFPADNIWNQNISELPVDPRSSQYIASIGSQSFLHPDFGSEPAYGIPYNVVDEALPGQPVSFLYADESDPGPYPIPPNPAIEQGSDQHLLILDTYNCYLYELYDAQQNANGSWQAGSGAIWNLRSNALRPAGWTSADAAGLPIFPGLVRYDEVASGAIDHALRFTVAQTSNSYIWPARHEASQSSDPNLPPMGLRLRLKASVDISGFAPADQVILTALKQYGMIVADNGSNWYLSGASDPRWDDTVLDQLKTIPGSDFEVVDTSSLMVDPNSGQAGS